MKTRLHALMCGVLICGLLFLSQGAYAQVDYSEDFEAFEGDWTGDFFTSGTVPCTGTNSFLTNIYGGNIDNVAISPSMGISNGGEVTFSYDYKIMNYPTWPDPPTVATPNSGDWGYFEVSYSISPDGPFTVLETVDTENHIESTTCATRTVTFTPPAGVNVYIKIYGEIDNTDNDFYIFFDNIEASQADPEACTGTPADIITVASTEIACTNEPVVLTVSPPYALSGISYQWQSSLDGTEFADIEGAESWSYTTTQPVTTWYRVKATCEAGGDETISTPVEVESNGELCFCEVAFETDVEPITLVQFAGIDNESDPVVDGTPALEDFTSLAPAEVVKGVPFEITLQGNTGGNWTNYFKVYIDFNHNGNLNDEGESFEIGTITQSTGTDGDEVTGEIIIPTDAMTGLARMRVFKLYGGYPDEPCSENEFGDPYGFGQAEDYMVNISEPSGCTTAPEMAIVETNQVTVCTTEGTELSLSVDYTEDGISFQWQSSEDGEEFTDIEGAIEDEYETAPTTMDMWYRAVITCENGDLSTTTEAIEITTTGLPCYCEVEFSDVEPITLVQFAGIDNESDGALYELQAIEDYTSMTPGEVMLGQDYEITIMGNTGGEYENYIAVYIDFNHNGSLSDEGEVFEIGYLFDTDGTDAELTGMITIPEDAMTGLTYMRVVKHWYSEGGDYPAYLEDPCGDENTGYGQAEDYLLNVSEPPACTTPAPTVEMTTQEFCNGATLADIVATPTEEGGIIVWYLSMDAETALPADTLLADGTAYFAAQLANDCEGDRVSVLAMVNMTTPPVVNNQVIEVETGSEATVEDLTYTGEGTINWYANLDDVVNSENSIEAGAIITPGTYYATLTVDGCESDYVTFTVEVLLGTNGFTKGTFTYYPNPVKDMLKLSYSEGITGVEVFNLVGQRVINIAMGQNEANVDMSSLASGTYVVKVSSGDAAAMIKVVKE